MTWVGFCHNKDFSIQRGKEPERFEPNNTLLFNYQITKYEVILYTLTSKTFVFVLYKTKESLNEGDTGLRHFTVGKMICHREVL